MFYMKERLGAWQVGDDRNQGRVEFKLFFPAGWDPQIQSIRVAGSFQNKLAPDIKNWNFDAGFLLTRDDSRPEGTFWSYKSNKELPGDYYEYKYLVTFSDGSTKKLSDPCTRYGGSNSQNAAFVVGGSRSSDEQLVSLAHGRKPLRDLIIYEMMIDDFTAEFRKERAPLDAVRDKLEYIRDLGFNAILFMPWTAWRDPEFDWGYAPLQYFAVEYRYAYQLGHPAEKLIWLRRLINECHKYDLHVIMDGVYNHASMDFPYKGFYLNQAECPYTGDFGKSFPGLQELNFNNTCTQEFIRDVCIYWIDEFGIDGIRFDNTTNYVVSNEVRGLPQLLEDISSYTDNKGDKNFSLTLEHLDKNAAQVTNETKATSYWDNGFYESCFSYLWDYQVEPKLLDVLNNSRFLASPDKVATTYKSNHDHSYATWQAGAKDNCGSMSWYKTQPCAIALMTSTGTPMVKNGQEFGEDHWIPENDQNTGRRVLSRPLRWKQSGDKIGEALLRLYKRLNRIRNSYPGLRSRNFYPSPWEEWMRQFNPEGYGIDTEKKVMIYHRWGNDNAGVIQRFIVVINFSDTAQWLNVPFPENGIWNDLLSGDDDATRWKPEVYNYRLGFEVGSHWGHIFYK